MSCPSASSLTSNCAPLRVSQIPCKSGVCALARNRVRHAAASIPGVFTGRDLLTGILFRAQHHLGSTGKSHFLRVTGVRAILGEVAFYGYGGARLHGIFAKPAAVQVGDR